MHINILHAQSFFYHLQDDPVFVRELTQVLQSTRYTGEETTSLQTSGEIDAYLKNEESSCINESSAAEFNNTSQSPTDFLCPCLPPKLSTNYVNLSFTF